MEPVFSFGEWMRRRRRALGLTQAELGERIGLATVSIHKIEVDERRPSHETALLLAAALQIPTAEHDLFLRAARAALPVDRLTPPVNDDILTLPIARKTPAARRALLPIAPNPLLGRERELAELQQLLDQPDVRLVTITGPGGVGKTRLALALAEILLKQHPGELCFAPLAPVAEPAMVAAALLHRLGIREVGATPRDQLAEYLRDQRLTLVLDNFEHLLEAALDISSLLATAPLCRFVITSRAPLHIRGEHEYLLNPLALPPVARTGRPVRGLLEHNAGATRSLTPDAQLLEYPAVQLFAARAREIQHDFTLSLANAAAIAAICVRLDGLPLAIELAAARIQIMTPQALLAQLAQHERSSLDVLTGGAHDLPRRQQTLRQTLEWSYQLLDPAEQILFRRLAVFAGGWTLDAVEVIAGAERWLSESRAVTVGEIPQPSPFRARTLNILQALVEQSLVQVAPGIDNSMRFEMLETIREFASELLEITGERAMLQYIHAQYYAELAAVSDHAHRGRAVAATWSATLEADLANIRAALAWSVSMPEYRQLAARLAGRLGYWWMMYGYQNEGRAWLERALRNQPASGELSIDDALAYYWAGNLALTALDTPKAHTYLNAGRAIYQALDDADGVAYLDFALGRLARETGRYAQAETYVNQALQYYRNVNDWRRTAFALESLADIALDHGRTTPARQWLWEAYDLFSVHGDVVGMNEALVNIARTEATDGNYPKALQYLEQALALARTNEIAAKIQFTLLQLGQTAVKAGLYDKGIHYLEQAITLARDYDDPLWLAVGLYELARAKRATGHLLQAAALLGKALTLLNTLHLMASDAAMCLEELAGLAVEWRQLTQAVRLFGAVAALRARIGIPRPPGTRHELERDMALARAQLDATTFRAAWGEGEALALPQAINEALQLATAISSDYHVLALP